jgi:hypothetical protein
VELTTAAGASLPLLAGAAQLGRLVQRSFVNPTIARATISRAAARPPEAP